MQREVRLMSSAKGLMDFEIHKASEYIGAKVAGAALADIIERDERSALERLRGALDEHLVLHFGQQGLTAPQIEALGRYFGPLMSLKRPNNPHASHIAGAQYLKVISNVQDPVGTPLGDGSSRAQDWHTDGGMKPQPATYSYFYARQVPPRPPKTYWMNAYRVYESLPERLKARIADRWVIHHYYAAGNEFPLPQSLPLEERMRGPRHPLVRIHPVTGRPILYLPQRVDALVVGLDEAESRTLIGELREIAAGSPYWWGAALQVDDFVIWDNRPCLHRRDGWDDREGRVMWHLANEGEVPIPLTGREPVTDDRSPRTPVASQS
jgi:taurine dioxygenase